MNTDLKNEIQAGWVMESWDYAQPWYHGSPLELRVLREGSTITQDRHLATVFSHKPTVVSMEDDGRLRHNGTQPGRSFPEGRHLFVYHVGL